MNRLRLAGGLAASGLDHGGPLVKVKNKKSDPIHLMLRWVEDDGRQFLLAQES